MNNNNADSMKELLHCFPVIEPPITISGEIITSFSSKNPPIPSRLIAEYFGQWDKMDEYTEYIPCFSLKVPIKHKALVYWKGSLLSYEFILIILSNEGKLLSKKVIAGTLSNNQTIKESVAVIQDDFSIYSVVGETPVDKPNYKPENSTSYRFEILEDGSIETAIEEEKRIWEEEHEERKT